MNRHADRPSDLTTTLTQSSKWRQRFWIGPGDNAGPRDEFSVRRGVEGALIRSGECQRMVTCVPRRAGAFAPNVNASPSHDLEAAHGVAGEKPRHVCTAQTLIARRAGKPMRATPHGSFGLSIRRRADAQEGRAG
jgi:hypothetical protein